jgi:hypothetical protein
MVSHRVIYILLIFVLLLGGIQPVSAQQGDTKTFDNGHTVSGEFLQFYNSVDDPQRIFGQPITVEFEDPLQPDIRIQYFDRVRMDYDKSQPAGKRIRLGKLGEFAHNDQKLGLPVPMPPTNAMCRPFSNGKSVCYGFMQLYDRYGEKYFGQPITNAEFTENGLQVQYFEYVRMEWRNEMPLGKRVVVSELGRGDFDTRIGNPELLKPRRDGTSIVTIKEVNPSLYAFTSHPLVVVGEKQSIYALLYDRYGQSIPGVSVRVTIIYPEGGPANQTISANQLTNELGFTEVDFVVQKIEPNKQIQVLVEALLPDGSQTTASTWFRTWW